MKTLNYFLGASALLTACGGQPSDKAAPIKTDTKSPNIILMLADDLGYNDLTCYRNNQEFEAPKPPTAHTPNLDKLAEQGMRFTDFYCGAAVCSPSRSALLTGRNAVRVGIYNWIPGNSPMHLRDSEVTIAELLKQKGYHTGHFGKWHLTSIDSIQPIPCQQGYDNCFWTHNNATPSHHNPNSFFRDDKPLGELKGYSCHLVVDEAMMWLDKNGKGNNPFYINVWFNEPHEKCAAPDSLANRHKYNQQYYGCIENMDYAVGRLMKYLEKTGLDENTLILFSSDNGSQVEYSNLPLKGMKCVNLEGGVRVPFIAKWKGHIPAGKVNSTPGSFTDVFPTIAEATGCEIPKNINYDGISVLDAFKRNELIRENAPITFYRYFHDPVNTLREGDWVLVGYHEEYEYVYNLSMTEIAKIKPAEGEPQWSQWGFQKGHMIAMDTILPKTFRLYNIKEDIFQENDLSTEHPEKLEEMKTKMAQLREEMIEEGGDWFE